MASLCRHGFRIVSNRFILLYYDSLDQLIIIIDDFATVKLEKSEEQHLSVSRVHTYIQQLGAERITPL